MAVVRSQATPLRSQAIVDGREHGVMLEAGRGLKLNGCYDERDMIRTEETVC